MANNELMPAKQEGYRPVTVEEELAITKSGSELLHSTNLMHIADARLRLVEEQKANLLRQLDDARKAIAAAQKKHAETLDKLGVVMGDTNGIKNVDGVWYLREAKKE